jgi:olefin beta-lactone synthetase
VPSSEHNIAHYLPSMASLHPFVRAVVYPQGRDSMGRVAYTHLTFLKLNEQCDRFAHGLRRAGIVPGTRVLLMVRPSLEFFALTFALFKIGAIPILIDPGMGWRGFMRCVQQAVPEALIGIPAAHVLRLVFRGVFRSVTIPITLGKRLFWGGAALRDLKCSSAPFDVAPVSPEDLAAILFTTGSTGPAKGVQYTHGIFCAQTEILRREYDIGPGDIDLPCFPLFALFSTALGATAVVPDMDPSRPAHVDPMRIIEPILDQGVTYSFGSPTLWNRVGAYCVDHGVRLPTLRRILMAGAPVPGIVHKRLLTNVLPPGADTFTPYGATESLPVANFRGSEMLSDTLAATTEGAGMCVGKPIVDVTLKVIRITDAPIEAWDEGLLLPPGEIGEIVVKGQVVTRQYDHLPEATHLAKIHDGDSIWHRMGDVGYLDDTGRLWFCGRKAHRVETADGPLYTVRCEAIFNTHDAVYRTALVGVGPDRSVQTPVIIVETHPEHVPNSPAARDELAEQLLAIGATSPLTRTIRRVLFHRSFPVDIRHNAKIKREQLAAWAQTQTE